MSTPKISMVLPNFGGGGAERIMVFLANSFAARGIETTFLAGRAEGPCLADLSNAVRLVDLNVPRFRRAIPSLVRHMNGDAPNAVLSALTHANLTTLFAAQLARNGPKIVVAEHNSTSMLARGDFGAKKVLTRALIQMLYPRAHRITFVSNEMQAEFVRDFGLPPDRLDTIYNPVAVEKLQLAATVAPTHEWIKNRKTAVIVGAGRLTPQKDFETLLRAFAIFARQSDARLVIFGEGPDRNKLQSLRAELGLEARVDLPGFVANLPAELSASDLFVLSSRWEGLPGVLLEALALDIPVVATDCPTGPNEILAGGKWGRMVPVGDPSALALAMHETLTRPIAIEKAQVLGRFDPHHIVDQYLSILLPGHQLSSHVTAFA